MFIDSLVVSASQVAVGYSLFSLTWPASMQIYWNKRKCLHKKRVQLPQDWFGTPTWPPFHCFGTQLWPPWRHVKTHNTISCQNNLGLHLGCHTGWLSYFTLVCLWCGLTVVRSGGRCTVTWLPNFLGWVDLLTHSAPLACASRGRELRYKRTLGIASPGGHN